MTTAGVVVLTVIITLALVSIGFLIYQSRKNGDVTIPWDKIRPILTEVFTEAIAIREADAMGYDALENHVVSFIKAKIDEADFFVQEEKDLLSVELIKSLITPRLKEIYYKKG